MTLEVDVGGGGFAGHCAALTAAQPGAIHLLLEKQPRVGVSTVFSGGLFTLAGTTEQERAGNGDSVDLLLDDLWDVSGHRCRPRTVPTDQGGIQVLLHGWIETVLLQANDTGGGAI